MAMSSSSLRVIGIEDDFFVGEAPGFGGSIKSRAADFVVDEIDVSGRLVEVTSFDIPSPPISPPTRLSTAAVKPQTATASRAMIQPAGDGVEQPSDLRKDAGADTGSGGCDGRTRETGGCADSAGADPSPVVGSHSATAAEGIAPTDAEKDDESPEGWARQLQQCLGGSGSKFAQLVRIDAAARGTGTPKAPSAGDDAQQTKEVGNLSEADNFDGEDGVVRVPAGHGADKAARARVHRAIQETFPFVKTATEKEPDGSVTVVCTQAAPLHALHGILSEQDLEALQRMVNRGPGGTGAHTGVTLSSDGLDRANRTLVHRAIAEAFPYLQTKTSSDPRGSKSQQVSVFWSRRRGGGGNKRKRQASDSNGHQQEGQGDGQRSRWVRFGLRKEGCEHHRTALALSKVLRVPLSALSFGGIKDKIAITTQACVVRGAPPRKILETNGSIPRVTVGNLSYCERGLSLGDLSGNKFSVVVRGAEVPRAVVKSSLEEACSAKGGGGFVNFFGTQRVGSPAAAARGQPLSFEIGRDALSGDWEAAVRKILRPRENDPPFLKAALSEFLEGKINPKECAARVRGSNRLATERLVLQGLVRFGASAFQAAVQCVPYGMRTMWVHAYQSHVWNSLACARVRLLGPEAVPGDLVYPAEFNCVTPRNVEKPSPRVIDTAEAPANGETTENQAHSAPPFELERSPPAAGATSACSMSIEAENARKSTSASAAVGEIDKERRVAEGAAGKSGAHAATRLGLRNAELNCSGVAVSSRGRETVTVLTKEMIDEAFASEGITARDLLRRVALPLAGTSIKYPTHEIGAMYKQRLEQDGVDPLMWPAPTPSQTSQDALDQPSTFPAKAAGAETGAELAQQAGVHAGARENQRGGAGSRIDKRVVGSSLVPKGAYRRLLCVPTDVSWEPAAPWKSADHEDDKNLQGPSESRSGKRNEKDSAPLAGAAADGGGHAGADEVLADVRLTFTLPPGSFATMFLREVMKRNDDIAWSGSGGVEEEGGAEVGVDGCSVVLLS